MSKSQIIKAAELSKLAYESLDEVRTALPLADKVQLVSATGKVKVPIEAFKKKRLKRRKADTEPEVEYIPFDTQVYLIYEGEVLYVAFRGTQVTEALSYKDIVSNILLGSVYHPKTKGYVHKGYWYAFKAVEKTLRAEIQDALVENKRIVCVGHSLGGCLASIAAVELRPHETITFGQPAVGNRKWAKLVDTLPLQRYVLKGDIAPCYPFDFLGYRQGGTSFTITHEGEVRPSTWQDKLKERVPPLTPKAIKKGTRNHWIEKYIKALKKS